MNSAEEKAIAMEDTARLPRDSYVQQQADKLRIRVAISGFSFKDFLTLAPEGDIDLTRNPDTGRDVEL